MLQWQTLWQWLFVMGCCGVVCCVPLHLTVAEALPNTRAHLKLMVMVKDGGHEGSAAVEHTLIRMFQGAGYEVLDANIVAQTLRRHADVLRLYEIEAAKQLGSRLGADMVVSGESTARTVEKTYALLDGKKVHVSQADVSAKVVLVQSGKVVVAENARASKPFDTTGAGALQAAAEAIGSKLLQGMGEFLSRDTLDYQLFFLNVSHAHTLELREALRTRVPGVRGVSKPNFVKDTLELELEVEKQQDMAFKRSILTNLAALGVGNFDVVAREGETIYFRRIGGAHGKPPERTPQPGKVPRPDSPPREREQTNSTARTGEKAERPAPPTPHLPTYKLGYRKSWAVVIGINTYHKWPQLSYAVNDAQSIAHRLKQLGFDEIITIFDNEATQQNILRILGDDLYTKTQDEDRVFIFFSGHGQTQDLPHGNKVGYIIPVEGDLNNYYSTAISMQQLQELSDRLRAKHILYVMDACFSGLLLRSRGGGPDAYAAMPETTAPVRQVLTAGSEGEKVFETEGHGIFTKVLLEGLQGPADRNGDQRITASELYQFITPRVVDASQNTQNPILGRLGLGHGEFIF